MKLIECRPFLRIQLCCNVRALCYGDSIYTTLSTNTVFLSLSLSSSPRHTSRPFSRQFSHHATYLGGSFPSPPAGG
jgi:hypothetical protein